MKKQTITAVNRRLDILARDICKIKAEYRCQRCGVEGDSSSIEWAHIEARKKKAIRWSEMNSLALCNGKLNNCHYWFDSTRAKAMKWLEENFPEKHSWLLQEEEGISNSEKISNLTLQDRILLEKELKERKKELNGG